MTASVTVTRAAIRTVLPMMAGIGASNSAREIGERELVLQVVGERVDGPKGRDKHHDQRRKIDDEEPCQRRREREGGPEPRPAPQRSGDPGHPRRLSALAGPAVTRSAVSMRG